MKLKKKTEKVIKEKTRSEIIRINPDRLIHFMKLVKYKVLLLSQLKR